MHIPNIIPDDVLDDVRMHGIHLRKNYKDYSTWRGVSCASTFAPELMKHYTSDIMRSLSKQLLGDEVYLFNDQVVYKFPWDGMDFVEHYDNQYGPNTENKIHTVNISWMLDDFTKHNGTLTMQNADDGEWVKIFPKAGDVIAIRGSTYHRSSMNVSNEPRGLYACVYTESPLHLEGFYYDLFEKVISSNETMRKYSKES